MTKRVRPCKKCGAYPRVRGFTLCVDCMDAADAMQRREELRDDEDFQHFMSLSKEERWREIWDAIQEIKGH